jgi:hypothetical protein
MVELAKQHIARTSNTSSGNAEVTLLKIPGSPQSTIFATYCLTPTAEMFSFLQHLQEASRMMNKPKMSGTQPNSIFRVYIKPAAKQIGLTKRIGWHTFRHTFGTILNANGENPKVIQELLRHATLKVTMDTYVQAMSDEKRKAQSKVVKMLLPGIRKREAV